MVRAIDRIALGRDDRGRQDDGADQDDVRPGHIFFYAPTNRTVTPIVTPPAAIG
jgi:hypothetical protein